MVLSNRSPMLAAALFLSSFAKAQHSPLTCQVASGPLTVRAEGRAERVGDLTLNCSGGSAGARVRFNLMVFLNRPIANRATPEGLVRDVMLFVDQGTGLVLSSAPATLAGS